MSLRDIVTTITPILNCASILSGIQSIGQNRPHFDPESATCTPQLIPRDVIFGNADVQNVEISHDGKYLAMVKPYNGVLNIWIQDIPADETEESPPEAYPVTFDTGRGINVYEWTYMEGTLLYRQNSNGTEDYEITKLNINTNETQSMTEPSKAKVLLLGVSSKHRDTVLLATNARSQVYFDVFALNLDSGEKTLIFENNRFGNIVTNKHELSIEFGYETAPDGGSVIYRTVKDENGTVTGWEPYRNISFGEDYHTYIYGFNPNAPGKVIWIESTGRNLPRLVLKDIANPEEEGEILYEAHRATNEKGIFWPNYSTRPILVAENYMRQEYTLLNKTYQAQFDFLTDEARKQDADWYVTSYSEEYGIWIVEFVYSDASIAYFQMYAPELKFKYLFSNRAALSNYTLSRTYSVELPVEDDFMQVCYLTLPRHVDDSNGGIPTKPVPMVLKVHGGPWARTIWEFDQRAQFMANRGLAVLDCNFRGSIGYGKDYFKAGIGEWSKKMHNDLLAAVDWAVGNKVAIPDKVAVYGENYGGYAALVAATFTPNKFACGVDIVGMSNVINMITTMPAFWKPGRTKIEKLIGGDVETEEGREFFRSISPLYKVDQITKPLLIAQGRYDVRVKRNESQQIVDAMKTNDVPVTYIEFANEGHGFVRPENQIALSAIHELFLADCLGSVWSEPLNEQQINASAVIVQEYGRLDQLKKFHASDDNEQDKS